MNKIGFIWAVLASWVIHAQPVSDYRQPTIPLDELCAIMQFRTSKAVEWCTPVKPPVPASSWIRARVPISGDSAPSVPASSPPSASAPIAPALESAPHIERNIKSWSLVVLSGLTSIWLLRWYFRRQKRGDRSGWDMDLGNWTQFPVQISDHVPAIVTFRINKLLSIQEPIIAIHEHDAADLEQELPLGELITLFWTYIYQNNLDYAQAVLDVGILGRNMMEYQEGDSLRIAQGCLELATKYRVSNSIDIPWKLADLRETINLLPDLPQKKDMLGSVDQLIAGATIQSSIHLKTNLQWAFTDLWVVSNGSDAINIQGITSLFLSLSRLELEDDFRNAYAQIVWQIGTYSDPFYAIIVWLKLLEVVNRWGEFRQNNWQPWKLALKLEHAKIERAIITVMERDMVHMQEVKPEKLHSIIWLLRKIEYELMSPSGKWCYDRYIRDYLYE